MPLEPRIICPPLSSVNLATAQTRWPHCTTAEERIRVAFAVGFDYLMNPAYMNILAISSIWASRRLRGWMSGLGSPVAWLCWSVAVSNAVENVGLYQAVVFEPRDSWPLLVSLAHYWAGVVVLVALVYVILGSVARVRAYSTRPAV